ncbi:MAG: tyrosine-type recombinase/integrase [Tepidisphaeraceae bacterium]
MAGLKQRGSNWYLTYYVGAQRRAVSLDTDNKKIALEKKRQFESAQLREDGNPLPTRTPVAEVVGRYVDYIRTRKTANSAQKDVYYLRDVFGAICPQLEVTSRIVTPQCKKRPVRPGVKVDGRRRTPRLEVSHFETISSADLSSFIALQVQSRGLSPKTANRYREILCRLFNWAMNEGGIKLPGDRNPLDRVARYKERAGEIRFLTLQQIDEQLAALQAHAQLQTMVAVLVYAGLRREELLWLTHDDVDLATGAYGMLRIRAKTIEGRSWQPKTRVNRVVPISSTLRAWLDRYARRIVPGDWFFPSPKGRHYDIDNFSSDLKRANAAASLAWTCLDYRHTFGSQLAMKGESLYKIATLMGNSPEICRRHYAALAPESLTDSVEFGGTAIAPLAKPA